MLSSMDGVTPSYLIVNSNDVIHSLSNVVADSVSDISLFRLSLECFDLNFQFFINVKQSFFLFNHSHFW